MGCLLLCTSTSTCISHPTVPHGCSDDGRTDTQLPILVTAAVDAIHLRKRLNLQHDIEMSGQVVWTGKSAMDIRLQLTQVAQHAASSEYAAPYDATQTANLGLQSCLI